MQVKQRARSKADKLERKDAILVAAETLLRQSGYEAMTMQAVATKTGLGKGTLYLYFSSRELLVLEIHGRLFDRWIDRFASQVSGVTGVEEFCQDFYHCYTGDPLFLQLTGFVTSLIEPQLDHDFYIKSKRSMASRVKKLAGIAYYRLGITPALAQKFSWGLLTVASGANQMTVRSQFADKYLPGDVVEFICSTSLETVFLNAAVPLYVGIVEANT